MKVWIFGFIADIIGASILFILGMIDPLELPNDMITGINYDPFSNPAVVVIIIAMLVSAVLYLCLIIKLPFLNKLMIKS